MRSISIRLALTGIALAVLASVAEAAPNLRHLKDASITAITGEMGTRYFLNFEYEWRNPDGTEFEYYIIYNGTQGTIPLGDPPPHPGSPDWDRVHETGHEIPQNAAGILHVKIIDIFTGQQAHGSIPFQAQP